MPKPKEGFNIDMGYPYYKEQQKKRNKTVHSRALYKAICKELNKQIAKFIIEGFHVELPSKLGILKVIKRKTNLDNLRVDFDATKKLGQTVYHLNLHSDGWYGSWKWTRFTSKIGRSFHYIFKPTDANKSAVSKTFQKHGGHKKYTT